MRPRLPFVLGLLISVASNALSDAAEPIQSLIPREASSTSGAGASFVPMFSRNGRFITFLSHANNLVTNDDRGPYLDIFVRDLELQRTELASVRTSGVGGINQDAISVTVSSDGNRVAFASWATNLTSTENPRTSDVFVRDAQTQQTHLVGLAADGGALQNPIGPVSCANPLITSDGRFVFYESRAANVVPGSDVNNTWDVFARDLNYATNVLVSERMAGEGTGNNASRLGTVTSEGRFVALISSATDLIPDGPTNAYDNIYLRDLRARMTLWASRDAGQYVASPFICLLPAISDDGRFVAFKVARTNEIRSTVLLFDSWFRSITNLSGDSSLDSALAVTADGGFVIFDEAGQLYRFDTTLGTRSLLTFNHASISNPAAGISKQPTLSPGGRWLAFVSSATDLVPGVTNGIYQIYLHDLSNTVTRLITRNRLQDPSMTDHDVSTFTVRDDGAVAFDSRDDNLVLGDENRASDVFLRILDAPDIILVSARYDQFPAFTEEGFSTMARFSVSSDARRIGFTRMSRDSSFLKPYVRDLRGSYTIPLHVLTNICSEDRISGRDVAVSGDGRYAAFLQVCRYDWQIVREDLFAGERREIAHFGIPLQRSTNAAPQLSYDGGQVLYHDFANVYLYSAASNSTELISLNSAGTGPGNRPSFQGVLSPDGRYVLFASLATDLVTPTTPATFNLFLRDLKNKTTRLVSTTDFEYGGYAGDSAFSANAQHIAFTTAGARRALLYGISNQVRRTVCDNCENPNSSADGRWVVYETRDGVRQVMLRDMQTGVTNLVSKDVSGTGGGNANSTGPLITSEGRFVIFVSRATNVVAEPTGGEPNIFVYDRVQNVTWLASAGVAGIPGGRHGSVNPVLGPDGHTVVFESFAGNLVPGDYNEERDLFVLRLGSGDTDGDALPDDWEVAYFGDLSRNGSADKDADGHTDAQEFAAGTDPTNRGSVLRVFTLSFGAEGTRIFWSAVPGKSYRAEYKNDVNSAWENVAGTVTATNAAASLVDASGAEKRFYRVVLVD